MMWYEQAIDNLKNRSNALCDYDYIMKIFSTLDVSKDQGFQRSFTRFYKVRRSEAWRKVFFSLFEENKTKGDLTFESILCQIYKKTGRVEASFSSKMLATLNPCMPIWDSVVLSKLQMKAKWIPDHSKRLRDRGGKYSEMVCKYSKIQNSPEAQECIAAFDRAFPDYHLISDVKKLDFLIWSSGNETPFAELLSLKDCKESLR